MTSTSEPSKKLDDIKKSVVNLDDKDKKVWELITEVPKMSKIMAIVCLVLNCVFPGIGTIIASFFFEKWSKTLFFVGFFQFSSSFLLIGWIFSIYMGILIFMKSVSSDSGSNSAQAKV